MSWAFSPKNHGYTYRETALGGSGMKEREWRR